MGIRIHKGIKVIVSVILSCFLALMYSGGALKSVNANEPGTTVELKQRDWSKYCSRNFYNCMSDKDKALYDKMDEQCLDLLEGRIEPKKFGFYYLPSITSGDFTKDEFLQILTRFLSDNPQYFFTSTAVSSSGDGCYSLLIYPEFAEKNDRNQAANDLFDSVDSWVEEIKKSGSTGYELEKKANDMLLENVSYDESSEGVQSIHQSIYSVFVRGGSVCRGYSLSMTILMNALGVPCWTVENGWHSWNKIMLDDGKWYATDVTWNDTNGTKNKYLNQSDEAIKFNDQGKKVHTLPEGYPAPKCESTYYPPGETVVWDGGAAVVIFGGDDKDDPEENNETNQENQDDQNNQNSQNNQNNQNSNNNKSDDNTQNNKNETVRDTKSKYSNEWVDGKWYDADGKQTYKGKLQWKCNSTGWWVEDTDGWYPSNQWQKIDGTWYFFKPDGYMASNEYYNGYWFNSDGSWDDKYLLSWKSNSTGWWVEDISGWWPSSSWLKIDGSWYYFNASGYMVSNQYVDGWWIDADGVCR